MPLTSMKIYTCEDIVANADFIDINYTSAGFTSPPIIVASSEEDVNIFASNITTTTARLNFSSKINGRVTYIVRNATT